MSIYSIVSGLTKTIQAPQTISGAATGVITVGSTTGWATGDIALISGVGGATGVNGLVRLAVASSTTFTVTSLSNGATLTFGGSYTSGGTVTHVGFQSAALTLDNTVFASVNPDFTLKNEIAALSAATGVRVHISDTGDAFANDIKPGPCFFAYGTQALLTGGYAAEAKRYDAQGLRLGNANNGLRLNVFIEGALGAVPSTGQSVTFSTWIEA